MKIASKIIVCLVLVAAIAYYFMIPRMTQISVSEFNDTSSTTGFGRDHHLYLDEDSMFFYNGEPQFTVPKGSKVTLRVGRISRPEFTIEEL